VFKKLLLSTADVVEDVGITSMAGFPEVHIQRAGETLRSISIS
jgi:hypothetical protein